MLDRPRVDVTLRISGLFRDAFEAQVALFDEAVRAVAARDEAPDWNPLAAATRGLAGTALRRATARVFGAVRPGATARASETGDGSLWLTASAHAYGRELDGAADRAGFAARVGGRRGFRACPGSRRDRPARQHRLRRPRGRVRGGRRSLGGAPALYHLDTSRPDAPAPRTVAEEVARVVRGRAANPRWIAGMMRHGYRGAAEIARSVEALHAFAATLPARFDAQFDLMFERRSATTAVDDFLQRCQPRGAGGDGGPVRGSAAARLVASTGATWRSAHDRAAGARPCMSRCQPGTGCWCASSHLADG